MSVIDGNESPFGSWNIVQGWVPYLVLLVVIVIIKAQHG